MIFSVSMWYITTLNYDLSSFVLFSGVFSHSVHIRAVRVELLSLNWITYSVLVVSISAIWTFLVISLAYSALLIWVFAESVRRYLLKVSVSSLSMSVLLRYVLILMQFEFLLRHSRLVVCVWVDPGSVRLWLPAAASTTVTCKNSVGFFLHARFLRTDFAGV